MHKLNHLKTLLIKELEGFADNGSIFKTSLGTIDTLAHATKNIIKIIESCDGEEMYEAPASTIDADVKAELIRMIDRI